MVISGIETVGFVPVVAGVPAFDSVSWFGKIREEGKYDKVPSGIKLSKGSEIGAGHLFSFEFTTVDITGFDANNTANDFANDIEGGFEFWCFAYGVSNVLWREAVTPVISFNRDNKSGDLKSITFKMSVHRGSNADIKAGANLLRDEVANASYAVANWTATNAILVANGTAHGSFTSAVGKVYALSLTTAAEGFAELDADADKLPAKNGDRFRVNAYVYSDQYEADIVISMYDDADTLLGTVVVANEAGNLISDSVLIDEADTAYITYQIYGTADFIDWQFNRLFLGFGGASRGYSET